MASRKPLSLRQEGIMDFIRKYLGENRFPPSIREIGKAVGISSTSVVNYNLRRLEERGYLSREKEVSRGLRLSANAPDLVPSGGVLRIPIAGPIAAGEPIDIGEGVFDEEDAIELTHDLLPQHDNVYALQVRGDSMIDAMVSDGDIVIMRQQHEARNGDMVAAWLTDRDETTLKYFFKEPDRIRLQPANPTMDPIYVDPAAVQIQGKVLMVLRRLS
ncbi:MAG: transcriptional repressor LexA [Ardenticatenales bacterium]|nr:transcriptional repressor LexA [Ardenticatenales bacterium]